MSFKIGQLRKNQLAASEYQIEIDKKSYNIGEGIISITQPNGLNLEFNEGGFNYNFKEGTTYFLDFSYELSNSNYSPSGISVYIKLLNENGAEMIIKKMSNAEAWYEKIIFTPNRDYNFFVIQIERNSSALRVSDLYCEVTLNNFYQLNNILQAGNFKNKFSEVTSIKKLGLQAPEGLIFAINGKDFKVGKSGVYEVEDVNIKQLCFYIAKEDTYFHPYEKQTEQFFIMDFEY